MVETKACTRLTTYIKCKTKLNYKVTLRLWVENPEKKTAMTFVIIDINCFTVYRPNDNIICS